MQENIPHLTPFLEDRPPLGDWRCNSWKTVNGYRRQSRKYATCLIRNPRPYHDHVVVSIDADLTIEDHRRLWSKIARQLRRRGVVAFWVREINRRGRVHYHLVTATEVAPTTYTDLELDHDHVRVEVEPIRSRRNVCCYVVKSRDIHADSRRYFHSDNSLDKIGTVGRFWAKPQRAIWSEVIAHERELSDHRQAVYYEATELSDLVGEYIPFGDIIRRLTSQAVEREKRNERGIIARQLAG